MHICLFLLSCTADPGVVVHCQEPTKVGNLTLVCTVDSPDPYTVAWLHGEANISEANEKYHTFHNLSDYFLVVTAASQKDRREKYTCVVTTDFSQTKREFQCCKYSCVCMYIHVICLCNCMHFT